MNRSPLPLPIHPLLLLASLFAASALHAADPTFDESQLLGNWCAGDGPAAFQEFALEVEDGEHRFNSWLHQRPELFGAWTLRGDQLDIDGIQHYRIVSAGAAELQLRNEDGDVETYRRECDARNDGEED